MMCVSFKPKILQLAFSEDILCASAIAVSSCGGRVDSWEGVLRAVRQDAPVPGYCRRGSGSLSKPESCLYGLGKPAWGPWQRRRWAAGAAPPRPTSWDEIGVDGIVLAATGPNEGWVAGRHQGSATCSSCSDAAGLTLLARKFTEVRLLPPAAATA